MSIGRVGAAIPTPRAALSQMSEFALEVVSTTPR